MTTDHNQYFLYTSFTVYFFFDDKAVYTGLP